MTSTVGRRHERGEPKKLMPPYTATLGGRSRLVDVSGPNGHTGGDTRGPRWAYVLGIIVIAAVVVAIAIHLVAGGLHRHELP